VCSAVQSSSSIGYTLLFLPFLPSFQPGRGLSFPLPFAKPKLRVCLHENGHSNCVWIPKRNHLISKGPNRILLGLCALKVHGGLYIVFGFDILNSLSVLCVITPGETAFQRTESVSFSRLFGAFSVVISYTFPFIPSLDPCPVT
jgi:hypothetical protein